MLVNNVGGVHPRTGGFLSVTDEDWQWALEMNLFSAVRATRAAVPHLIGRAPSTIVTVGFPGHSYLAEGSAPLILNSPHGGMPANGALRRSVTAVGYRVGASGPW
jgi:NAD(P)-dependent dehydrogenase (short-subunit alcohol dehydrogenase family)